ncbi:hypothetical protein DICA2_D15566 [Diutina catenulata]
MKFSTAVAVSAAILSVQAAPAAAPNAVAEAEAEPLFGLIGGILHTVGCILGGCRPPPPPPPPQPVVIYRPYPHPGWRHRGRGKWHRHPRYHDDCGCYPDIGYGVKIEGEDAQKLKAADEANDIEAANAVVNSVIEQTQPRLPEGDSNGVAVATTTVSAAPAASTAPPSDAQKAAAEAFINSLPEDEKHAVEESFPVDAQGGVVEAAASAVAQGIPVEDAAGAAADEFPVDNAGGAAAPATA